MKREQKTKMLTARAFEAMPEAAKQKIIDDLKHHRVKFRRPTAEELAELDPIIKRMAGRPKLGKGTRAVTVTIERDLLKRADALARAKGLKRSQLFTRGLRYLLARKSA